MAAIQHILAANQQRSQMVYINANVRQHFSPPNVLSDRAAQSKYRLPHVEIQRLVTLVSPHIQRATRCNFAQPGGAAPGRAAFYAVWSFLEVVGDGTGLSKASVSRSVAAVTPILLRYARTQIRIPTTRAHALSPHLCTCFFWFGFGTPATSFLQHPSLIGHTAISSAVKEGDLLFRLLAAFSIVTCLCLATGGIYICVNGLDNYLDTPVSCDHTHKHARV